MDDGVAVHYTAIERGTPVYSSDEVEVGSVRQVLDNYREHIFDGFVIDTPAGQRFVDAPEVARTAERGVTLTITAAEAAELGPPEEGSPNFSPSSGGRLSRLFGGGPWKRR
ncbi:MAG: hypothetical protein H0V85_00095 [Thermoleophilaceae bacterium]|nr:hypothetical protein [Thermoleophilaceae bacterium]